MKKVQITETVLRDANQSLMATRLPYSDFAEILPEMNKAGYYSVECWGGATFDSCLRYLGEDPWQRLRDIRKAMPDTKLQMLLRGQNLLGYKHYHDDVVEKFVELSIKNGIDILRIFDALNDFRNIATALEATKKYATKNTVASGCISYTQSPVHTVKKYVEMCKELKTMGFDTICLKDMAGTMSPYEAEHLIKGIKDAVGDVPLILHTHCTTGMAYMTIMKAIEAGVDISFQRVIRFSAGMDSVVQAAGRCNRHAEQKKPAPVRLIRCTDERLRGLDDIVRGQNATTALLTAFSKTPEVFRHDLSSEESIRFYYRRLYTEMEPGFQDDQTPAHGSLYHLLADNPRYADANCAQAERYLLRQAFRLAGSLFQVFDEDTSALLVPYGRGCELQNTLRNAAQVYGQKDWAVIRGCIDEAKGYCVSVYRYQLERLESLGAVTSLFDGGILLLSDGFYNEHTGFSLEAGTRDFQEV